MINRSFPILAWLINLFNPPPLKLMSRSQKVGRVLLITTTLLVICILSSMVATLAVFLVERGHRMLSSIPNLMNVFEIIFVSACRCHLIKNIKL